MFGRVERERKTELERERESEKEICKGRTREKVYLDLENCSFVWAWRGRERRNWIWNRAKGEFLHT